jgi:hypothetical protein
MNFEKIEGVLVVFTLTSGEVGVIYPFFFKAKSSTKATQIHINKRKHTKKKSGI